MKIKFMIRRIGIFIVAFILIGCSESKTEISSEAVTVQPVEQKILLPIPDIVGKELSEIEAILGNTKECSDSKYGRKCIFNIRDIEIVFIEGKADWITINSIQELPFSKSALPLLGLEQSLPAFVSPDVIRWENLQSIKELSIFPAGNNVAYVYMKVKTL